MADTRTNLNDLPDKPSSGELSEDEAAAIAGGQDSQRLTIIDTIHSNGTVTGDFKELPQ